MAVTLLLQIHMVLRLKRVIDHVRNDHPEQYGAYIEERNKLLKELSAIERLKRWWNGDHLDINDIEAREA